MTALYESRLPSRVGRSYDIRRALRALVAATAALDALVLCLTALLTDYLLRVPEAGAATQSHEHMEAWNWTAIVIVWLLVIAIRGGYSERNLGHGTEEFRSVALASLEAVSAVGLVCFLVELPLPRDSLVLDFLAGTSALLGERYLVRRTAQRARKRGRLVRRIIAVGGPSGVREVLEALRREAYIGYRVVGACLPNGVIVDPTRFPVPVVGVPADVRHLCEEMGADTVVVAGGGCDTSHEVRRIAWNLEGSCVDLVVVPSLTDVSGPRLHVRPVAGLPFLHVEQSQAVAAGGFLKRLFDVCFAALALLLVAPLFLVTAALVKMADGGPVLFRQERVGRNGATFKMFKFRSMVIDAEARLDDLFEHNDLDGVLFKMKKDPRITFVGKILRRFSIDELPQLVNVLRGEMSVVGPRPPLPAEVGRYAPDVHRRLLVRPGLTGLWQVSGRSRLSWDESVRLDLYYVDNWSMISDLAIIAKTARAVICADGAF